MIRIEPRQAPSRLMTLGIPVLSAVIALALATIPLAFAGASIGLTHEVVDLYRRIRCNCQAAAIDELIEWGVEFDKKKNEAGETVIALGREAAEEKLPELTELLAR